MSRVFFSDQVTFTYLAVNEVQVDSSVLAFVYLNGSTTPHTVLALAPTQITEEEYSPGLFRYNITDYEVPSDTTSITVTWQAYVSSVQTDTFPVTGSPTLDTQLGSDYLEVTASTPAEGAVDVNVRTGILITFDESLDSTALVPGQMFLQRVGTVNVSRVSVKINPNDTTQLVISPQVKLDDNATYELHIPIGTVLGGTGAGLEYDYKLTFKTAEDDVQTLYQATDDKVVERAGPLKIVVGSLPSSAAAMTSSLPANQSCNQSSQEIVFTFSEDIDPYNSVPALDISFAPVFGIPEYYLNNQLWGQDTEPTHPTDVIDGGAVAARATIQFDSNPSDGETLTLDDGVLPAVTFEFESGGGVGGGNTAVTIGVNAAATMANLITEITNAGLAFTQVDNTLLTTVPSLLLINNVAGVAGNVAIGGTHASLTVTGFAGGVDEVESAPHTTVAIIGNTVTVTLNEVPTGNAYMTIILNGLVTLADPSESFDDAEITYVTGLFPMRISVPEIRNCIRRYISSDLTDCDIAILITQMGLELYEMYGNQALIQQKCVIKTSTVMVLLQDYMETAGLDGMKQLGPFTVSNKSTWFMNGPLKDWQAKLKECEQTLTAYFNRPLTGIKSSGNVLERPTGSWRIRTWNNSSDVSPAYDENKANNRAGKIPPRGRYWS